MRQPRGEIAGPANFRCGARGQRMIARLEQPVLAHRFGCFGSGERSRFRLSWSHRRRGGMFLENAARWFGFAELFAHFGRDAVESFPLVERHTRRRAQWLLRRPAPAVTGNRPAQPRHRHANPGGGIHGEQRAGAGIQDAVIVFGIVRGFEVCVSGETQVVQRHAAAVHDHELNRRHRTCPHDCVEPQPQPTIARFNHAHRRPVARGAKRFDDDQVFRSPVAGDRRTRAVAVVVEEVAKAT